jgi:hypothetical protein
MPLIDYQRQDDVIYFDLSSKFVLAPLTLILPKQIYLAVD